MFMPMRPWRATLYAYVLVYIFSDGQTHATKYHMGPDEIHIRLSKGYIGHDG